MPIDPGRFFGATYQGDDSDETLVGSAAEPFITFQMRGGDDSVKLLRTDPENHNFFGGSGKDFFSAGEGDDLAIGGAGRDRLLGRDGADVLLGGGDRDKLKGGDGGDYFEGGGGGDILNAGNAAEAAAVLAGLDANNDEDDFVFDFGDSRSINGRADIIKDLDVESTNTDDLIFVANTDEIIEHASSNAVTNIEEAAALVEGNVLLSSADYVVVHNNSLDRAFLVADLAAPGGDDFETGVILLNIESSAEAQLIDNSIIHEHDSLAEARNNDAPGGFFV